MFLSVEDVAKKLKLSRMAVYNHEMGGMRNPPLPIIKAYAELYRKTFEEIETELCRSQEETGSRLKRRATRRGTKGMK